MRKDVKEDSIELTALTRNAQSAVPGNRQAFAGDGRPGQDRRAEHRGSGASDATSIAVNLNLNLEERQQMLETNSVKERLTRLLPMLNREHEVLTLSSKIQTDVASSMSKTQRDFFLREQCGAIQRELGEGDINATDTKNLREQIEQDADAGGRARRSRCRNWSGCRRCRPAMAEYGVARHYLDWIINLPWGKTTEDKIDLKTAKRILDEQHFGLTKVKDRLLEFLAVIKLKKQIKGPILCLVGPPGVGKTSLGKSVADALGRKFARISLGGMRDEAEIRGHRRTYVGALPGRILHALRRAESKNPVILLDEIDKVGADFRGDPSSALLEVLDPAQNSTFTDHYLDLPFDLSRVLFITTANWLDPIHPALRDRLEVIELPGYTASEKLRDRQTSSRAAATGGERPDAKHVQDSRPRVAPGDPGLHARSGRAAVGTGNRRADAQGRAQNRQPQRRRQADGALDGCRAGISRAAAHFLRDGGEHHGERHRHRAGVDAGGRGNSVH